MNSTSADTATTELTEREFSLFRDFIFNKTGISLRDTKCPMLSARLQRRLRQLNLPSFGAYYQLLLDQDPAGDERRELINCVTTNKTSFFVSRIISFFWLTYSNNLPENPPQALSRFGAPPAPRAKSPTQLQ